MIHLRPHQQRCFDAMQKYACGQVIVPTGGGKTYIMIQHALELLKTGHKTIVVAQKRTRLVSL
jgi:superfamily II DNA or RNA helicase